MKKPANAIIFVLLTLLFCPALLAQGENPFVGTWDIDKAASDFGGAPVPANMSRTYADLGNGSYMYLVATVNPDGSLSGSSATYNYSGSRYPIASLDPVNQARISYRKLNERTVEYRVFVQDVLTQIGAKTISPDGRVLQIAIQYPNSPSSQASQILVFNKRR